MLAEASVAGRIVGAVAKQVRSIQPLSGHERSRLRRLLLLAQHNASISAEAATAHGITIESFRDLRLLWRMAIRMTPSAGWADEVFIAAATRAANISRVQRLAEIVDRADVFPPGGFAGTAMLICRTCDIFQPPRYFTSSGHCFDCENRNTPFFRWSHWQGSCGCVVGHKYV